MAYLGTKPADQIIDSTLIADGTVTPADLSTGKPVWNTSGDVGIGNTNPAIPLEVTANTNSQAIRIRGRASDNTGALIFDNNAGNAGSQANFIQGTPNGQLIFGTNNTERMRIAANGRVSIGTTAAPYDGLTVYGSGDALTHYANATSGTTGSDGVSIGLAADNNAYVFNREATNLIFGTSNTERMRIDSSGRVTTPAQPAFRAYANSTIDYSTGNTKITVHDQTFFNIGNHYNTSNQRFTAPVAGVYLFSARAWANVGNTAQAGIMFVQNGGTPVGTLRMASSTNQYTTMNPTTLVYLNVNDYIELFTEEASASGVVHTSSGGTNSMFAGYFLG